MGNSTGDTKLTVQNFEKPPSRKKGNFQAVGFAHFYFGLRHKTPASELQIFLGTVKK